MAIPGIGRAAGWITRHPAAIVGTAAAAGLWAAHPARPIFQGVESMAFGDPNAFNKMRQAALGGALYRGLVPAGQQTQLGVMNSAGYGYGDDYSGWPEMSGPVERPNPASRNPGGPAGDPRNFNTLYARDLAAATVRVRQDYFLPPTVNPEGIEGAIPERVAVAPPMQPQVNPGYVLPPIPRGRTNRIPTPDGSMVFGLYNERMQ